MQSIRCLALAAVALFMAGCSSFTSESATPLARGAQWGLVPLLNYSQAPQAGERAEQILLSVLAEEGVRPRLYPAQPQGDLQLVDDRERSSARWTGHASRSWPTWSPAASRSGSTRTASTASRRWASACRCWSRPPGGALEHQRGARRLVPGKPGGRRAESPARAGRRPAARVTAMSAHKDFALAPRASGSVSWVETLVISALALGLGWWFSPDDPLQVNATFPWVILAPLLLGMRYGFVRGLASAALLVAALFAFRVQGVEAYAQVPAAFIVGVLLCAMLVGEFRDIWERRLERLELANEYRQLRLDEFTRAHHILRISHDRLEQRVAGNDQSLRSSLLGLRQLLRELPGDEAPLDALAETVLALLAQYGSLRIAGLYRVRHDRTPEPQPLATLGEMPALDADDLLVRTCLERGELVSVRQELLERGEQRAHSALQVCVPLVDTDGRILALLAVEQMPFFVFNERTFSLLAILAGHIADLLQSDRRALQLADIDAQRFSQYLKRSLLDARDHGLPACLYAFELTDARYGEEVQRLLEGSQRGLDVQLRLRNDEGRRVLLVLLPLTSAEGSQGYLQRLRILFAERFGQARELESLGVRIRQYELDAGNDRQALGHFLFNECGLNDQQVAV